MMKIRTVFSLVGVYFLIGLSVLSAQQVGINTTTPSPGSILDIESANNGILIPRVDISDLSTPAPVTGGITTGLLVYNISPITENGFYFWNGSSWKNIIDNNYWRLLGNSNTNPTTDFVGTTDNTDFELFTNNSSRLRVQSNGQVTVGFGANSGNTNQQFNVLAPLDGIAIGGYSSDGGSGVYGINSESGFGVLGINNSNGTGIRGENSGSGVAVSGEHFNGGNAIVGQTNSGALFNGIWGTNANTNGTAIIGSNGIKVLPAGGVGVAGSSPKLGVFGYAGEGDGANANNEENHAAGFSLDRDSDPSTANNVASARLAGYERLTGGNANRRSIYVGGYFSGGLSSPAVSRIGMKEGANNDGTGGTNYKILGNGTVSTLIHDSQGTPRIMFTPESPEIVFQDYGIGRLVNGEVRINLDPVLKNSLHIDRNNPLKVFVTLEGDCNGVFITNKSADGFTVKELNNGTSNVSFSWKIVANRADDRDTNGNITSKHVGLRFPVGPEPLKMDTIIQKAEIVSENKLENPTTENPFKSIRD